MKLWSKWVAALAIGAAFIAVPAAQAATAKHVKATASSHALVKKSKIASKAHKKAVVSHSSKKKTPAKHGKKLTPSVKGGKGSKNVKWHHPQLHKA